MGVSKVLFAALCLVALVACQTMASPSLDDIANDLSMMEEATTSTKAEVGADAALTEAQKYAEKKVADAMKESGRILAAAEEAGRKDAIAAGPAPVLQSDKLKLQIAEAKAKAQALAAKVEKAKKKAIREAKAKKNAAILAAKRAYRKAQQLKSPFISLKTAADHRGVFGGVSLGISKAEAVPVTGNLVGKKGAKSAFNKFGKYTKRKDIYGNEKSCLKDIAAHFDEKDIYESKKLSLIQKMASVKSLQQAQQLRSRLKNLETWHQMMQKKFLASASEMKEHKARVAKLMDEYLPADLKNELAQNKVAKRAGQKLPFPDAKAKAMKILRQQRKQIEINDRLNALGHKKMVRPEINDPEFPSMDPISSSLRERLWRTVGTEESWSTDKNELEKAENIVTAAHKAHGDFVEGPIAEPLLKGKLYHPSTERLGVPNFLTKFPWPKTPEDKTTMDDKVKVEQTYHQTW